MVREGQGRAAEADVPLFKTAYDTFRVHTICDDAPMEVDEIPERWSCPDGHGDILPGRRLAWRRAAVRHA